MGFVDDYTRWKTNDSVEENIETLENVVYLITSLNNKN